MKPRTIRLIAVCVSVVLLLAMAGQVAAQAKKPGKAPVRYSGTISMLSKDASQITLLTKTGRLLIRYTDKTLFTFRNKPATLADVKEGLRAIILVDAAGKDMVATRVDMREGSK